MPRGKRPGVDSYQVRMHDRYEHRWFDHKGPCSYEEALALWNEKTKDGTRYTCYDDGTYYDIFPAHTRMLYR